MPISERLNSRASDPPAQNVEFTYTNNGHPNASRIKLICYNLLVSVIKVVKAIDQQLYVEMCLITNVMQKQKLNTTF